jgi:hypothetical protein
MKRYPRKLAYNNYVNFCQDENYLPFSNIQFGLKLKTEIGDMLYLKLLMNAKITLSILML